jgi:scavenger receptor class B protein 1
VPSTDFYKQWIDPPVEAYLTFNLFSLKNPGEFLRGEKPNIEEIGPFVYREYISKENVTDNQNFTLSFGQRKVYQFRPELSKYNESFEITTVSLAPIVVMDMIKFYPSLAHDLLNMAFGLTNETLLVTKTANELLFGYQDNLLVALKKLVDPVFKGLIKTDRVGFYMDVGFFTVIFKEVKFFPSFIFL